MHRNGAVTTYPVKIENYYRCCSWDQWVPCDFEITWRAIPGSGGHLHNTNRPPGKITTDNLNTGGSITTGPDGYLRDSTGSDLVLTLTYEAPEASGSIEICAQAWYLGWDWGYRCDTINVEIGGLVREELPSAFIVDTYSGVTIDHGHNNGYALPELYARLRRAAELYASLSTEAGITPPTPVRLGAMSLPKGGLKDLYAESEWHPPHWEHRNGDSVDVNMAGLTPDNKWILRQALTRVGLMFRIWKESWDNKEANHWHLVPRQPPP